MLKMLVLFLFLMTSLTAMADEGRPDVEQMLSQMVRENVISKEEAEKAKIRFKTMNPHYATRMPASVSDVSSAIGSAHAIDLDGEQFKQIQNDLNKIAPQYKN